MENHGTKIILELGCISTMQIQVVLLHGVWMIENKTGPTTGTMAVGRARPPMVEHHLEIVVLLEQVKSLSNQ